jgi:hypothetical protein
MQAIIVRLFFGANRGRARLREVQKVRQDGRQVLGEEVEDILQVGFKLPPPLHDKARVLAAKQLLRRQCVSETSRIITNCKMRVKR